MKKFLALVLALVMTMSLVTISAGAEDFTDDASITYEEAVDVMTAVGVVGGYADGSFNPTAGLTRGAAAKIICNMILGPTTAEALVANEAPFSDVAVDNVFAGYIAYCVNEGIISGYADGTFKPAAPLTGYAFMKMLLGALGYDASIEGYVGSNWSIAVAKRALNIGLDDGLVNDFSGSKALTREEACLYAFNAMNSEIVEYPNKSTIKIGDVVISQDSEAKAVKDNWTFANEYFEKLTKVDSQSDAFGRPAHKWYTDKTKRADKYLVGTYTDTADYTLVVDKDYDTLEALVAFIQDEIDTLGDTAADKAVNQETGYGCYFNGAKTGTLSDLNTMITGAFNTTGVVVELFMASNEEDIQTIVTYAYTLAKIDEVDTDVSKADEEDDITAYIDIAGDRVYDDIDFAGFDAETYVEDAYIAYIVDADAPTKVIASYIPEVVTGTVSAKSSTYVKVDGVKYTFAGTATDTDCDFTNEFDVYVDANDYALGVVGDTSVAIEDVFYVTDLYAKNDAKLGYTYYAETVSLTGETADIVVGEVGGKVIDNAGASGKVNYTSVNAGLYEIKWDAEEEYNTLTAFTANSDLTAKSETYSSAIKATASTITVDSKKVYVDDATKFVSIKLKEANGFVKTVATAEGGMALKADAGNKVIALYDSNSDAAYVLYIGAAVSSTVDTENVVFVTAKSTESSKNGYETEIYFMDDNTSKTVTTKSNYSKNFYTYAIDEDGVYELTPVKLDDNTVVDEDVTGGVALKLTAYHDNVLTGENSQNVDATDIAFGDAEIIDLRSDADTAADEYDREIASGSTLKKAMDTGVVKAYVYFVDGVATFIAVYDCPNA